MRKEIRTPLGLYILKSHGSKLPDRYGFNKLKPDEDYQGDKQTRVYRSVIKEMRYG